MAKIALLIGVSEYLPEFPSLPSTMKDVEAMKEVLGNSEMGGFDDIKVLKNSNRQQIEEAIYKLFANRNQDDVLLLYFAGHGVKSKEGNLFLATPQTRKEQRGIVTPTAVSASFLQSQMNQSLSKRLVVILDCCYSGAFTNNGAFIRGIATRGNENAELGGEGKAILMSSSSTQSSFESEGSELSIYTKYLVEGIKTGAADTDNNGKISADELNQYVKEKVRQEYRKMTPQFEARNEGHRIYLASSPQDDPNLKFPQEVKEILIKNNGKISLLNHNFVAGIIGVGVLGIGFFVGVPYISNLLISEPTSTPKTLPETPINSKYSTLEKLLKEKKWKEADEETVRLMLKVPGLEEKGHLTQQDIENFPCTYLRTIDQLWVENSNNKFGFSVQKKIYQKLGGTKEYDSEVWHNFGDEVGWRRKGEWLSEDDLMGELNSSSSHPEGHLPFKFIHFRGRGRRVPSLSQKLVDCNI